MKLLSTTALHFASQTGQITVNMQNCTVCFEHENQGSLENVFKQKL